MKFLKQARLAQPGLADDEDKLAVALPRPIPAPHQHRHFLVAADQRRELALSGAAAAAARSDQTVKRDRLRHAFEHVATVLLGHEQPGDLALDPCRNQDSARLGERLYTRRDICHVAVNLPGRIHHRGAGFDADARG